MESMAPMKLDVATTAKVKTIISDYYTSQQKAMQQMKAASTTDRAAIRTKRAELAGERDKKLAEVLTEAQLKKWKEEIAYSKGAKKSN
jgi:hypothetical protein